MDNELRYYFGADSRLKKATDFANVFNSRGTETKKINGENCILLHKINRLSRPRLGIIVSKKNVPLACARNRLKRIAKESFRLNQYKLTNIDCVLLIYKGADCFSSKKWRTIMDRMIGKLIIHF